MRYFGQKTDLWLGPTWVVGSITLNINKSRNNLHSKIKGYTHPQNGGRPTAQTGEHKMPISSCQMVIAWSINAAIATATSTATSTATTAAGAGLKFTYEDRNGHSSYLWPKSSPKAKP